jgi:hypothetical protein
VCDVDHNLPRKLKLLLTQCSNLLILHRNISFDVSLQYPPQMVLAGAFAPAFFCLEFFVRLYCGAFLVRFPVLRMRFFDR